MSALKRNVIARARRLLGNDRAAQTFYGLQKYLYWTAIMVKDAWEMSDAEIRARIIGLGFGGEADRFQQFCQRLREGLPKGTGVALRGSVVTAERWEDGSPFDADGDGSSDLDVTLIGDRVMQYWDEDAFYIPALHTKPLGDKDPEIAKGLNPLREELQRLVGRPVNFQATNNLILYARDVLMNQPYFTIIEAEEEEKAAEEEA
ncbi:MAG: hypothetical protein ICV60_13740 [Pyrinomonadaceae bacterium]|nr:hypothetical protein [Pyrinomonadaceae bacterium]